MLGNYTTKSATETASLGEKFGTTLKGGDLVLLTGELGGGKTQFTKGIAKALGIEEMIVSPTFTIERIYQGTINPPLQRATKRVGNQQSTKPTSLRGTKQSLLDTNYQLQTTDYNIQLHHFDLYRTKEDREIFQEIQDLLTENGNIVVVEWPENMKSLMSLETIKITFKYIDNNDRLIKIEVER